jgi:hypothetical protein
MNDKLKTTAFVLDLEDAEGSAKAMIDALMIPIKGYMEKMDDPQKQLTFFFFIFGGLMGMCTAATTPLATQAILSDLLKQHIEADQNGNFDGQAPSATH